MQVVKKENFEEINCFQFLNIHIKVFLSKNTDLVFQYSQTYNFNLLTDKSNSFRAFLNFKFQVLNKKMKLVWDFFQIRLKK